VEAVGGAEEDVGVAEFALRLEGRDEPFGHLVYGLHRARPVMMNRSDVLNNAYYTVERDDWPDEERKRETLEILKEMKQEANDYFLRYRWEVGLRR
jgi:hypothetical protein